MNEFILYLLSLSFLLNGTGHGVKDKNQMEEEQSSIIEEDVISEGLITKMVSINEKVTSEEKIDTPTNYLIDMSLKKQMEI